MYIPQVTSGPSSVTWSPNGREIIYSMQGSLWRQLVGATTATQLTSGTNYDFQPDWSPDGRSVVYTSYNGRTLSLMLLDLPTGESRPLLADSAVNVEPRWSPDGTRIAFVSTAYGQRFHVFVGRFASARLDSIVRITEDRDSGLPRYYYSRWDQYLSPTWSPDGNELIVVSNHDHVQGAGGLWRMEARPGAAMREIHYEETAWKARPDWDRSGKRVVFSSYAGRQWNQLVLVPSVPGDPVQLTYGEFDATAPRWSPDGSRIAYVSNEAGNTSLWIVNVPGGAKERVVVRTRRYRDPVGRLIITVVDSATRKPLPVRLSVRHSEGKFFAPDNAWRHADEAVERDAQTFEYGYWHSRGTDTLTLPAGAFTIQTWRGPEWRTVSRIAVVKADSVARVRITVAPVAQLAKSGWWSGDVHVHMNYGGAYRNTPARLAFQASAEGLSVVEALVVNKEQRIPDIGYWRWEIGDGKTTPISHLPSPLSPIIAFGQELHTSNLWGHASLLGARDYVLPDYAGYPGTALASLSPMNAQFFDVGHAQRVGGGGVISGYVHPFDFAPDLTQIQSGIPYELPVDVALGKVDFLEVMGYSDHLITSDIWYKLLNCGFRIPAAAGTDAFPNFAQLRGPAGLVRTYAKAGVTLDHRKWLDAVKAGRTFVTNAPLLTFTLNNREPGSEIRMPFSGRHQLTAHVALKSPIPIDHLELIGNGKVVAKLDRVADTTFSFNADRTGWYVVRAYSDKPRLPVLDLYPFASTSPIYVKVGDAPASCREDAEYFLTWINLLSQRVRADTNWNTPAEKERALSLISRAHEEFIRRR